jgi:hypothetical protein
MPATHDRWPSLLQERAEYIDGVKHVAIATQIQVVARGLDELAGLYGDAASIPLEGEPARPASDHPRAELIRRLEKKGRGFLRQAATTPDHTQAHQLRCLSVIFGGEAERLQVEAT